MNKPSKTRKTPAGTRVNRDSPGQRDSRLETAARAMGLRVVPSYPRNLDAWPGSTSPKTPGLLKDRPAREEDFPR